MRAHTHADDRDLGNVIVGQHLSGPQLLNDREQNRFSGLHIASRYCEREVRRVFAAAVLKNDVDLNVGLTDRPQNAVRHPGIIRHPHHRQLGFVPIEGNSRDNRRFHGGILFCRNQCPWAVLKTAEHSQRHLIFSREFYRANL